MRSVTVPSSGAVLTRLRRETATAHARVEDRLFPAALDSRAGYACMLRAMFGLHAPLERQFPSIGGFGALGVDLASRRKAHRIRADLTALGEPAHDGTAPAVELRLDSLPTALGAFYVLEGSTLGGRVLRTEVAERLGDVPTDFLAGYGEETGRRWRQTRAALVAAVRDAANPPTVETAMVDGAASTFAAFDRLLEAEGWPVPASSRAAQAREVPA
jgi:heme oxygenase (biliverdin-IX-beta and delta-forming)